MLVPRRFSNPVMEVRDNMEATLNVDFIFVNLRAETSEIHASALFHEAGWETRHIICDSVGATSPDLVKSNWKAFGEHLGLTPSQIRNIENWFTQNQGPVWGVLASYAQLDEARVEKVIHALYQIERYDVINLMNDIVLEFAKRISVFQSNAGDNPVIFRLPWVAEVLRPRNPQIKKDFNLTNVPTLISNPTVQDDHKRINNNKSLAPYYTVMLTYSNDGTNTANRITRILREHKANIGVLRLDEQLPYVWNMGNEFIIDCIAQVDAVMPILTQGYYDQISSCPTINELPLGKDQECVDFIYKHLSAVYAADRYRNNKIRCLIPADNTNNIRKPYSMFGAYMSEARIDEYIKNLLHEKAERRRLPLAGK